ncbi:MAG: hypothetical protein HQK57_10170 [Deltaproteobacteria bacterium]|nr:hypothetical protein [Deltaproteobacteria bacterium]
MSIRTVEHQPALLPFSSMSNRWMLLSGIVGGGGYPLATQSATKSSSGLFLIIGPALHFGALGRLAVQKTIEVLDVVVDFAVDPSEFWIVR